MPKNIRIVSMMLCNIPKFVKGRIYLSASDCIWDPVEHVDKSIHTYFTDEYGSPIGDENLDYGGFLQIIDTSTLKIIADRGLFACFRGIERNILDSIKFIPNYPPNSIYEKISHHLVFMGWDICQGNGWVSASCEGIYPVDPLTGEDLDENAGQINRFGLFDQLYNCRAYCEMNNMEIPEHSPWYLVAVYVDDSSYDRLQKYYKKMMKK